MGTLQGSVATANGVLQVAVQTLHAAQAAAVTYPIDQDPRIVALQGSRAAAQCWRLQAAQGVLATRAAGNRREHRHRRADGDHAGPAGDGGRRRCCRPPTRPSAYSSRASGTVADVAGYIAQHGLGALLDVRSASFDGSISATTGGSVTLDAAVVFQGTTQTVHVSYDFKDLVAGAKALAKAVLPSLPI